MTDRRSIEAMWLRRAFYQWLLPAALVLPLWLLIGWIAFSASGWALLWVIVIAIPSVLVGQLLLTLLARARGTVRHTRALSWWDVGGFALWHLLTIAVGFFSPAAFWPLLTAAVVVFIGLVWLMLWQLFREAKPSAVLRRATDGAVYIPPPATKTPQRPQEVIIVSEKRSPGDA
ncbi:Permease of the major facilitator superfamily [uncultured Microbacterium sp.]|uniref:Permease of the major facilitator superfamily n=2 Tax=uncultured Microbacterium sp. TaxID=191216 RepID=A0A1Y5NZW7_9MICO|nr:Permease of the major facilitator superfamily [uncultured Microbacterium sp.]